MTEAKTDASQLPINQVLCGDCVEVMKTLAMMKMEKNFVSVIEKSYPRKPYEYYTLQQLRVRLLEEVNELNDALKEVESCPESTQECEEAKMECADVSNIIDYIFEKLSNNMSEKKQKP
jgi:NTP pyrophosphatase (non-canonical NTP hydrolase)